MESLEVGEMSYKLSWIIPHHLILAELSETIASDEMEACIKGIIQMMQEAHHHHQEPVHILFDQRSVEQLPQLLPMIQAAEIIRTVPNRGWWLIVTTNRTLRVKAAILSNIANNSLKAFATMDEAYLFLQALGVHKLNHSSEAAYTTRV